MCGCIDVAQNRVHSVLFQHDDELSGYIIKQNFLNDVAKENPIQCGLD